MYISVLIINEIITPIWQMIQTDSVTCLKLCEGAHMWSSWQLTLLTITLNQTYLRGQCPALFLSLNPWPSGFHPCQTHIWSTTLFLSSIKSIHNLQFMMLNVSPGNWKCHKVRLQLCTILPTLYDLTKAEVRPVLWDYLLRASSL